MISGIIKGWEAASRFFSFPGFKRGTIFLNHSLKDPGLAGNVLENLQKSRPVVLLYFDLVKFHEVEQMSGFQAASKILAMFKKSLEREIPEIVRLLIITGTMNHFSSTSFVDIQRLIVLVLYGNLISNISSV